MFEFLIFSFALERSFSVFVQHLERVVSALYWFPSRKGEEDVYTNQNIDNNEEGGLCLSVRQSADRTGRFLVFATRYGPLNISASLDARSINKATDRLTRRNESWPRNLIEPITHLGRWESHHMHTMNWSTSTNQNRKDHWNGKTLNTCLFL